jgi:hypothetical protein
MQSNWASDVNHNLNKVNLEFWQAYFSDSNNIKWIEIGYKHGRGYDASGQPDTAFYNGLFSAKYHMNPSTGALISVSGNEWSSKNWASG